jgi:hypothetical protein
LAEFSSLAGSLGGIYDKLALIIEGYDPFNTYDGKRRWKGGRFPESRLLLKKIRYLLNMESPDSVADLKISVWGTNIIQDALYLVDLASSWSPEEKTLFWRTLHLGTDVANLLQPKNDGANKRILFLEEKYDLSLERLLEYLGPELQALDENKARYREEEQ